MEFRPNRQNVSRQGRRLESGRRKDAFWRNCETRFLETVSASSARLLATSSVPLSRFVNHQFPRPGVCQCNLCGRPYPMQLTQPTVHISHHRQPISGDITSSTAPVIGPGCCHGGTEPHSTHSLFASLIDARIRALFLIHNYFILFLYQMY